MLHFVNSVLQCKLFSASGHLNLMHIPKLSCLLKLDISVWLVSKLGNERHRISKFNPIALEENYPEIHVVTVGKKFFLIKDINRFLQRFPCSFCTKSFIRTYDLKKHQQKSCMFLKFLQQHPDSENPEYQYFFQEEPFERFFHCGKYGARDSLIARIDKLLGLSLNVNYRGLQDHCLCYDIETSQTKIKIGHPDQLLDGFVANHRVLCISVATDIPQLDDVLGVCFIKFDNSNGYLKQCLQYMLDASEIAFKNNKRKYKWLLKQLQHSIVQARSSSRPFFAKTLLKLKDDILKFMRKLPCFGFNSSSFDNVALRDEGFFYLLYQAEQKHPRALKSGNSYVMVDSGYRLILLDILSYCSGKCSLRKFLHDMNVPDSQRKLHFWYDAWTAENSQKMLMHKNPPKYKDFFSRLKGMNTLEEEYKEFSRLLQLGYSETAALTALELSEKPLTGRQNYDMFLEDWKIMKIRYCYQYLSRYCSRDTTSTLLAVRQFKKAFLKIGMNPFYYSSLSSMAFPVLVSHLANSCKTECNFFTSLNHDAFYLLKRSQIGGLTHAFNRLAICGYSKIKPHQFGKLAKIVKMILGLDLNCLYPSTIGKRCTKAAGFYAIRRKENEFRMTTVMEKHHLAHSWALFMEKVVLQTKLRHALSFGGEKKLVFPNSESAYLDLWQDLSIKTSDGKQHTVGNGSNFHGCLWHACKDCYGFEINSNLPHPTIKGLTWLQVHERSKRQDEQIRSHPQILEYKIKWKHEWLNDIRKNPLIEYFVRHSCKYGPPMVRSSFSESEAQKFILEGKIVGFVEVSLFTPKDKLSHFLDFPPIFVREKVRRQDLNGQQRIIAENRNALGNGQVTILSKFSGDDLVIGTDLFIWYIENGLQVKELKTIIQFHENLAFDEWLDNVVEGRRSADQIGSNVQSEIWKLIGNGSYGFASLNLSKRTDIHFGDLKKLKYWVTRPAFYQSFSAGPEGRTSDYFEVMCKKFRVKEKLPLQFSCEVLSTSKRILFETIYGFCVKFFDPRKWCMLGADTDGFQFALAAESLDEIVKPELAGEFQSAKRQWLVPEESGPLKDLLKREPLYLKTEVSVDLASVHLASKSYILVGKNSVTKSAHKGFSSKLNPELVTLKYFMESLFSDGADDKLKKAKLSGLRQTADGHMGTFYGTRAALSNLSIKWDYCDSGIHCFPRDLTAEQLKTLFPYLACDIKNHKSAWNAILREARNTTVEASAHIN